MNFRENWLWLKFKLGLMTRQEIVRHLKSQQDESIASLPEEDRPLIRSIYKEMESMSLIGDIPEYIAKANRLSEALQDASKKYDKNFQRRNGERHKYIASADIGYRPTGARSRGYFINPFSIFSWYAEKHWAFSAAVDIIVTAVRRAGYSYVHGPEVPPERVIELDQKLKKLNIWQLRLDILKYYLIYGNAVLLPHYNLLGNLMKLELLVMDRLMPIYPSKVERLTGWDYWKGQVSTIYSIDQVLHLLNPSLKRPDIGIPPAAAVATDIESDLCASDLNYNVMYSGGMVGLLIALDDPEDGGTKPDKFAEKLRQEISQQKSGVKGANSVVVSNFIKKVHKIASIGDFEGSFMQFGQEVAKRLATVFKVPPARLNVGLKSQGVSDNGKMHDGADKAMDEAVAGYMDIVDTFINNKIIRELLGEQEIGIEKNGRYGTYSPETALAFLNATKAGPLYTVNDGLRYFFGTPLLGPKDPRGRMILDNSNRINKGAVYELADENNTTQGTPIGSDDDGDQNPDNNDDDGLAGAIVRAKR